jgi:thioredoxin 1
VLLLIITKLKRKESIDVFITKYIIQGNNMAAITITKQNFEQEVLQSKEPVLLDFWASWCGPCRMVSPTIDEIAKETEGIKVGKINVDEESELAAQFSVMSIPTLMVVKEGKVSATAVGARPKNDILRMLEL